MYMINKTLHYVWVGSKEVPDRTKELIEGWKKILGPSWKIKLWNENNFDVNSINATKYHYKKGNWAFVSDYIRAYAIYNEGGFYIDTDVKLLKSLNDLTKYDLVASRAFYTQIPMSTFGAKKGHPVIKKYMDILNNQTVILKQPKFMSTDIMSACVMEHLKYPYGFDTYKKGKNIILSESLMQLGIGDAYAIHEHHNNWKGKAKKFDNSKYLINKINRFNKKDKRIVSPIKINKLIKKWKLNLDLMPEE